MEVKELIRNLIFGRITLSQGLMLSKVLYEHSLCEDSYKWICNELDHYEDAATMPEYRVIDCDIKVRVNVPYLGIKVETLDTTILNRYITRPYASPNKMLIRQGIESIEQLLESAGHLVEMELSQGQIDTIMKFYNVPRGCSIETMYQECRVEQVKNIIPSVKNRLISILQTEVMSSHNSYEGIASSKKKVFISYGWDDERHCKWVRDLANRLSFYYEVVITSVRRKNLR